MPARKPLAVVREGDAPRRSRPKSLVEAAEGGDYRELLVAQRRDIARSLQSPETQGPARAALHRQLGLVAREIRELDEAGEEEGVTGVKPTPDEGWEVI